VRVSAAAFASEPVTDPEILDVLFDEVGGHAWTGEGADPLSLAVDAGLFPSRSEGRRAIAQGGLSVNGVRIATPDQALPEPVAGGYHLLRAGRWRLVVARRA
jgi:tyrosyl-tRNA synthetase